MALTTLNDRGENVPLLNIANVLTIIRLVLVPVFIVLGAVNTSERRWWALGIFVIAALTDKLDGHYARSRGLVTKFGTLADTLADKALIISALVLLSMHGLLWWWVTIAMTVREVGISLLKLGLRGRQVISASWQGKLKMVAQSFGITVLLAPWETFLLGNPAMSLASAAGVAYVVGWIGIAVALILAYTSAWGYIVQGVRLIRGLPE